MSMPKLAAVVTRLGKDDRAELEAHFRALNAEDRRLRFGTAIGDEAIGAYVARIVARIDFGFDEVFAARDEDLGLMGAIHVAISGDSAELGLSVLPAFRGEGVGSVLFERAVAHLRNSGVREVMVHCLTENATMLHLARKNGMRVVQDGSESEARLRIDPPTARSLFNEWLLDQKSAAIMAIRQNARLARALWKLYPPIGTR